MDRAADILELIAVINPLYWLAEWLIQVQTLGNREALHLFGLIMVLVLWCAVSVFTAELPARGRGNYLLWFLLFYILNVWAILGWWAFETVSSNKTAKRAKGEAAVRTSATVSSIVSSAVGVYSPSDLKEHFIQSLIDKNMYDDAIQVARNRIEHYRSVNDLEQVDRYQSMLGWIEAAKERFRNEPWSDSVT
jgi:hypothetical protein